MTVLGFTDNTSFVNGSPSAFYAGTDDTQLAQDAPTTNKATDTSAQVHKFGSGNHGHAIIRFTDLLVRVPAGATINAATLYLDFTTTNNGDIIEARRCLRGWVENQATWNIYSTGNNWGTAGCLSDGVDRDASATGTVTLTAATDVYYAITVTSAVQAIINAQVNNGFHLQRQGAGEDGHVATFLTSETSFTTARPELLVDFTPAVPRLARARPRYLVRH